MTVTDTDLAILLVTGIIVIVVFAFVYNRLLLDSLDMPLASASGVPSAFLDYVFVLLLTAAIVVSLKIIGALLVEAMVVVPAAAARNLARTTRSYLVRGVRNRFGRLSAPTSDAGSLATPIGNGPP